MRADQAQRGEGAPSFGIEQRERVGHRDHADHQRQQREPRDEHADQGEAACDALLAVLRTGRAVDHLGARGQDRSHRCCHLFGVCVGLETDRHPIVVVGRLEQRSGLVGGEQCQRGPLGQPTLRGGHDADHLVAAGFSLAHDDDLVADRDSSGLGGPFVDDHLVRSLGCAAVADEPVGRHLFVLGPVRPQGLLGQPRRDDGLTVGTEDHGHLFESGGHCGDPRNPSEARSDRGGDEPTGLLERRLVGDLPLDDEVGLLRSRCRQTVEPLGDAVQQRECTCEVADRERDRDGGQQQASALADQGRDHAPQPDPRAPTRDGGHHHDDTRDVPGRAFMTRPRS